VGEGQFLTLSLSFLRCADRVPSPYLSLSHPYFSLSLSHSHSLYPFPRLPFLSSAPLSFSFLSWLDSPFHHPFLFKFRFHNK